MLGGVAVTRQEPSWMGLVLRESGPRGPVPPFTLCSEMVLAGDQEERPLQTVLVP